jgi:hypothetical protein
MEGFWEQTDSEVNERSLCRVDNGVDGISLDEA